MIKLIHIDNFFTDIEDVVKLATVARSLQFQEFEYGLEIPDFNLVDPDIDTTFSKVLKEEVVTIPVKSGCFRQPFHFIHFESFCAPTDWAFAVALERSTFNLYRHESGSDTALHGYKYNYRNLFEWDYTANVLLERNQCVFYRPWLFHSFDQGLIHTYRLEAKP